MTPADEICTAAAKLRALATAAADDSSPGWRARRHFPDRPDSTYTSLLTAGGTPLMGGGGRNRVPYVKAPIGDYITTMDPTVGLALADWLDYEAALIVRVPGAELRGRTEQALAVARAINAQP